ncbi:unnamed protein product [Cyclocybe aegerita]|uniref:Sesquiterpene synthase Agr8 n=2 Tax=Cyclocybe aegerita TaxID=1973307 RepID=AGR8_CYCAE|nr:RecName: Full=Sesquiterpene synthase Agr8; AltName: Full=Terpene cyclase Agr8 [Cyclocybe aegerita]QGA30884.1 sesquiterpene synthase Agr8 [Cyclocybe aegerita]CAA7262204.1 unnamed protein product [Cyclocybe aegerita]
MSEQQYTLPDLLQNWPWNRHLSPYYEEAKRESSAWVESFKPFDQDGQRAFDAYLLASLTYSHGSREFVRLGCDLMNFYFVYDEYTDVSDSAVADRLANIVIDAMRNPENSSQSGDHLLGKMTKHFWTRALAMAPAGSPCFEHFITTSETYLRAVTQEAEDRANKRVRKVDDYLRLRRDTCGARPTLALIEFGLNLPNEVVRHPSLVALTEAAVDLIILVNDMHSYVRELSCGHENHNLITAIMLEHRLNRQDAFHWLGSHCSRVVDQFLSDLDELPSWGEPTDSGVRDYINGLGQWVRGNDDWSTESKRYYGEDGETIRQERLVTTRSGESNYIKFGQVGVQDSVRIQPIEAN